MTSDFFPEPCDLTDDVSELLLIPGLHGLGELAIGDFPGGTQIQIIAGLLHLIQFGAIEPAHQLLGPLLGDLLKQVEPTGGHHVLLVEFDHPPVDRHELSVELLHQEFEGLPHFLLDALAAVLLLFELGEEPALGLLEEVPEIQPGLLLLRLLLEELLLFGLDDAWALLAEQPSLLALLALLAALHLAVVQVVRDQLEDVLRPTLPISIL